MNLVEAGRGAEVVDVDADGAARCQRRIVDRRRCETPAAGQTAALCCPGLLEAGGAPGGSGQQYH